jgi:uncharacterized protein (DUF4415 family)
MLGDLLDQIAIDHDGIDWWVTDSSLHMDLAPPITAVPSLSKFDQMAGLLVTARLEHEIDTSDIPEWTEEMWKRAVRGKLYRPLKQAVSLRLDADGIAWLKKDGEGTRANQMLRERMLAEFAVAVRSAVRA